MATREGRAKWAFLHRYRSCSPAEAQGWSCAFRGAVRASVRCNTWSGGGSDDAGVCYGCSVSLRCSIATNSAIRRARVSGLTAV
jgi:hypothetical protein